MKISKILSCALIVSSISYAQDTNKEKTTLDDIIVTGSKLDKNLQETVSSVQVFTDTDFLNSSSLNDMYDIFQQTSNINRAGKYAFNIRGISSTGISGSYIGPRTINVSLDGVSQSSNASKQGAISTWDVEQIEILKGPQSTTQGRNSLAGAVVIKTKDPEFEANGAFQSSYGTNNTYQLSAMQTGAVNDNLALRLSVDQQHSDGFVTNDKFRGDKFNERDITNARGKALYNFDNGVSALLTLSKFIYDDKGRWVVDKNRKSQYNSDGYYDADGVSHSLELNFPINENWSLKSITSYANENLDRINDLDDNQGIGTSNFDRENTSFNQEFRLNYNGENSKSVFGFYHSRGEGTDDRSVENLDGQSAFGVSGLLLDYQQNLKEEYKNNAIFFNTDYYLNDKLTLILGARLDKDQRENTSTLDAQRSTDLGTTLNTIIDTQLAALASGEDKAENDTTNFVPKIGFNYKWNENINTGFLYSKGYRPGGMSVNPITAEASKYDKEYTNNYELSFKSQWLNKRLTFNTNLFYTIWKNQQVTETGAQGPFDVNIINAGKTTLKGIELNTKYQITDEVEVYGNIGYVKAQYKQYNNNGDDYSGNDLIKTPKLTGNIGANYRTANGYFLGGNVNYTGSQYNDSANERKIDPYTLVNVKVGYEENDWAVYLYANNLFDKDYELSNYGNGRYEFGDERVVGVNFKYYW